MGRALQNWDASQLSLNAWRELLAESLQNASRFAIHCWNDEEPWVQLALKYGQRKPVPWEGGTVIEGAVTPAFREMLLSLRRPDDRDVYNKFLPFFSLVLDDKLHLLGIGHPPQDAHRAKGRPNQSGARAYAAAIHPPELLGDFTVCPGRRGDVPQNVHHAPAEAQKAHQQQQ